MKCWQHARNECPTLVCFLRASELFLPRSLVTGSFTFVIVIDMILLAFNARVSNTLILNPINLVTPITCFITLNHWYLIHFVCTRCSITQHSAPPQFSTRNSGATDLERRKSGRKYVERLHLPSHTCRVNHFVSYFANVYQSRHYARLLLLRLLPAPASTYLLSRLELLSALQTHAILAFDNIELDVQEHLRTTSRRYFNSQDHTLFDDRWFWQHPPLITYMKNSWLSLDITITLPLSSLEVIYQSALLSNQVNDFRDILVWGHKSSTNKMLQDSNRKVYLEMAYAQLWTYNFSGIFKIHDLQERLKTTFRASDHLSSWKRIRHGPIELMMSNRGLPSLVKSPLQTHKKQLRNTHWIPKCTKLLKNVSTQWSWKGRKPHEGWKTHIIHLPVFLLYHLLLLCLYGICAHDCETLSLRFHVPWLNVLVPAIPIFDPSGWAIWAPQLKVLNKFLVDRMLIELRNENKQWQIALRELSEGACLCRGLGPVSPEPHWSPPTVSLQLNPLVRYWIGLSASPFAIHRGPREPIVSCMPDHVLQPCGVTSGLLDFITECSFTPPLHWFLCIPRWEIEAGGLV